MSVTQNRNIVFSARHVADSYSTFNGPSPITVTKVITAIRSRTGQRLPKWHKVIEDGGNATTPLSAQWDTVEYLPGSWVVKWQYKFDARIQIFSNSGDIAAAPASGISHLPRDPTITTSVADNRARVAFFKKLSASRTQLQGGVVLGELRETFAMLRRPAAGLWENILGYQGTLRKRKRTNPKNWTKGLADLWLEHAFGWQPFINDIRDAAKAIDRLNEKPRSKIISASGFDKKDSTSSLDPHFRVATSVLHYGDSLNGSWFWSPAQCYERCYVRYKGKLEAQVATTRWDNWALFGFSTEQFIPTLWELLPWSFLVDYFTNIGDVLNSICTSTAGVTYVNCTTIRTSYFKGVLKSDPFAVQNNPGSNFTFIDSAGSPGGFNHSRRLVSRSAGSGISYPSLQFESGLSSGQLGNVAALLASCRALHPQNPRPLHRLPGM